MLIHSIDQLIGNTPILKLDSKHTGLKNIELYAKLEYLNPFGSIKDRTAFGMLKEHIHYIKEKGLKVIETSSGNTAKGLQSICNLYGLDFMTVTNRIKISESKNILKFLGAEILEVPKEVNTVEFINKLMNESPERYFHTSQYVNQENVSAHNVTGDEVLKDIGNVDYFISVLGTSGSSTGVAQRLKQSNPNLYTLGVVTSNDSYIPGIRTEQEMKEVGIFCRANYDKIVAISGDDAKEYMQQLCVNYGILAGVSSGASYCAALNYLRAIDSIAEEGSKAVFIICDRAEIYANYIKERRFYKYHVLGNTYIVIDPFENRVEMTPNVISKICDKKFGVGADGIIYGPLSRGDVFEFRAFNSDGSEATSALFGSAIFAKYLKDSLIAKDSRVSLLVAGNRVDVIFEDNECTMASIYFCEPKLLPSITIGGIDYSFVESGNDNLVYESDNISFEQITKMGEYINSINEFSDGINLSIVNVMDESSVKVESYERGSGYTLASGTGIVASCFAIRDKLCKGLIRVTMPGGVAFVNIDELCLKASVYKIYEGEFED